MFSISAA
ncbi:hypothetical protein YPPY88_2906, partial [Yersinia pestis PY-88]